MALTKGMCISYGDLLSTICLLSDMLFVWVTVLYVIVCKQNTHEKEREKIKDWMPAKPKKGSEQQGMKWLSFRFLRNDYQ